MEILIRALQLLLSLAILVIIHEWGHFLFARLFKIRVEKFYLFFNPWFSLFKIRRGETEYGVGWLPLGGYVKISGMIDESMDKEQMQQPPKPYEFRSKPAWQRLLVMIGGVFFNVILAALIYVFMLAIIGDEYLPVKNMKYGIEAETLGKEIGLKTGDHIIALNGEPLEYWEAVNRRFIKGDVKQVSVLRNDSLLHLPVPDDFFAKLLSARLSNFISVRYPFIIERFASESPAKDAGLQVGDHVKGIGGIETWSFMDFRMAVEDFAGQETTIIFEREGEIIERDIRVTEDALIGVWPKREYSLLETEIYNYNFLEAIPAGVSKAYTTTRDYFQSLGLLFRPEVSARDNLGGFITIGSIFPATWNWVHFWSLTAFLSIILAIMNILPIPALDGGHVMFLVYEIIVGKKPPDKFMEYAQIVGMVLLFSLLIFVNLNDVLRLFR